MARPPRKPRRKSAPHSQMDRITEEAQRLGLTGKALRRAHLIRERAPRATKSQLRRMLKLLGTNGLREYPMHLYLTNSIADRAVEFNINEWHKRLEERAADLNSILETAKIKRLPPFQMEALEKMLQQLGYAKSLEELEGLGDQLHLESYPSLVSAQIIQFFSKRAQQLNPKKKPTL